MTDTLVDIDPDLRQLVVNAPDAAAAIQQLVDDAGPGLGSLVRNLDILNKVTIPRLDGVEQMLVTYPDVVSGGFTVVRNDSGVMRAHFGFVLNSDDPHACISGYRSTADTPSPGAVASTDTRSVACDVINGVDPNPSDGVTRAGPTSAASRTSDAPGESGSGPQSGAAGGSGMLAGTAGRPARRPAARQPVLDARRADRGMAADPELDTTEENSAGDQRRAGTPAGGGRRDRGAAPTTPAPDPLRDAAGTPVGKRRRRTGRPGRRAARGDGDGARTAPRARRSPLVPVLAVLLVLLLAGVGFLWFTRPGSSAVRADDYVDVLQAARSEVVDMTSFDYLTLDDDIVQIKRVTTGDLQKEAVDQLDSRRQQITDSQATVNTRSSAPGSPAPTEDTPPCCWSSSRRRRAARASRRRSLRYRIRVELEKKGGRWLLSGIAGDGDPAMADTP